MRKVECKVYQNGKWENHSGFFHQWGINCSESTGGNIQWTVAIVELEDGSIIMPCADDVKFIN